MKLKFIVNRMRSRRDGERDLIECIIERPDDFCKKVDGCCDEFDEPTYNRFIRQVTGIIYAISGLDCSPEWFFEYGPTIEEA